jgi:predicted RNA-binding protein with PUA-like domain
MARAIPRTAWLVKTEPDTFSIQDLAKRGIEPWDGVRNYQARNHLRSMAVGDWVAVYHSSCEVPAVVGIGSIAAAARPDRTQFDRNSPYWDPKATHERPIWDSVDVKFIESFSTQVPLALLKMHATLSAMEVCRRGQRLSVMPLEPKHLRGVLRLAGAQTRLGR